MDWHALAIATALLAAAAAALVAEVFVVSFGLLALVSLGLAIASVAYAFTASTPLGWGFAIAAPLIGGGILRWGLGAVLRSRLVPKDAVEGDAGYRHAAAAIGAAPGGEGLLVTAARPTGRARFAGGEIDVVCDRSAEAGERVRIERIAGAAVQVIVIPS